MDSRAVERRREKKMKPEKQLYQWDTNQLLVELTPSAQFVDYPIGDEVIRIKADGTRCRIPDEVFQTYGGKTCYERYPDGTYRAYSFTVLYAPKPPDYVYTPEERTTFEALTARVDSAIEEIKRRADSGEFTPVKGVDYFTDAEKAEMMESVSDGAIGDFRKVVDSATAEYNTNAEQHTTDYNRNATEKLESYNQNHTEKVAEYNTNAETKKAEFDSNAAALQTEVDRLRGECDTLAAENRKQENRISALMKLNKGQTYDILAEEGETASRTAPSGAKYVGIDKVGGKSIVWNQQVDDSKAQLGTTRGVTLSRNENGRLFASGTVQTGYIRWLVIGEASLIIGHKYLSRRIGQGVPLRIDDLNGNISMVFNNDFEVKTLTKISKKAVYAPIQEGVTINIEIVPVLIDLTQMFGAGNEPTAEQFTGMFPADSYPYNPGEIISSRTATITAGAETIETGFPELRSAGTAHDEIDMDGGQVTRNVYTVELETLVWRRSDGKFKAVLPAKSKANGYYNTTNNELCNKYEPMPMNDIFAGEKGIATHPINGETVWLFDSAYETPEQLVASLAGAVLHYELATPTTEPVAIPEALQEWLPVEAGGTVTFRNADESKQLAVPNAVSWVRKLNEVE